MTYMQPEEARPFLWLVVSRSRVQLTSPGSQQWLPADSADRLLEHNYHSVAGH